MGAAMKWATYGTVETSGQQQDIQLTPGVYWLEDLTTGGAVGDLTFACVGLKLIKPSLPSTVEWRIKSRLFVLASGYRGTLYGAARLWRAFNVKDDSLTEYHWPCRVYGMVTAAPAGVNVAVPFDGPGQLSFSATGFSSVAPTTALQLVPPTMTLTGPGFWVVSVSSYL